MLLEHIKDDDEKPDNGQLLADKKAELERLSRKRENLVDMRADDLISKEEFQKRLAPIDKEIGQVYNVIRELESAEKPEAEDVNYEEKLTVLQYALERYTDFDENKDVPPNVIEAFVERIVASKDGFEWYLRFDGDPNDPLKCSFDGKRKEKATLSIEGKTFPSTHLSDAGGA